tara:strand:+ start:1250 stop:3649 length:2400 start_codon:yes stop_codon:yes gene_type:complete
MAIINSYPLITPLDKDLLIGTEVYNPITNLPVDGSRTVTFSIASIVALVSSNPYVLPVASVAALGGVRLFNDTVNDVVPETITTTANRNYVVELSTDNKMLVNVPWTDTSAPIQSLTTNGISGAATLAGLVLNIPNYANTTYDYLTVGSIPSGTVNSPPMGSGYSSAINVATTGGSGTGMTVDTTVDGAGGVQTVTINNPGTGYAIGDNDIVISGGDGGLASQAIISLSGTVGETNPNLRLVDSAFAFDDVKLTGSGGTTITRTSDTGITISSTSGVTGSGAATRVAFWSSTSGLTSDSDLYWDNTNKRLGIGTIFPVNTLQVIGGNNADGPSSHRFQVTTSFTSTTNDNTSSPGIQLGYQNKSDVVYGDDNTYKTITPNLGVVAGGLGGIGGGATTITSATLGSNAYGASFLTNVTFADQSKTKIGMVVTYLPPTPNRVYGDGTAAQIYIVDLDMPSGAISLSENIYADSGTTLHFSYPAGVGIQIYQPAVVDGTYDASSNYTWYDNPGWYQAARFDQFGGVGFGQGLEQGDTEIGTVTLAGAATRAGTGGITTGGLNPITSTKLKFINRYTDTPGTYQERNASISLNYVGSTYGDLELNSGTASSLSKIKFVGYGSGNKTGTATYNLSVDSAGKIIETASPSTSLLKTVTNLFTASQIFTGGSLTFTMPTVPVGKQLLIQNALWYIALYGGPGGPTYFNAPSGYTATLEFDDGFSSINLIPLQSAQSFINSSDSKMSNSGSSFDFPLVLGDIVTTGGGTMELILPTGASGNAPTTGNGELYISIEYKEIATGSAFTL